ncbi:tyrosine-type recombinase/integrase, partial [Nocardia wallacei]|uniref:tyrosine-type recombinase/integrase n=1 Tax=Nocardia wallacei TaxID=480035 RepID=UPI00245484C2
MGSGPVRQTACAPWERNTRQRAPRTDGAVDQQRRPDPALVRRGRRSCFGDDHLRLAAALFPSERKNVDGSAARISSETLRAALAGAAARHLPEWPDRLTPHVLRHFCASQLYLSGMDLVAIQQPHGQVWVATPMHNNPVPRPHIEDAGIAG